MWLRAQSGDFSDYPRKAIVIHLIIKEKGSGKPRATGEIALFVSEVPGCARRKPASCPKGWQPRLAQEEVTVNLSDAATAIECVARIERGKQ